MIIVYCCYGGAHSSPIAAAIHLGELKEGKTPSEEEIWNIHYFDKVDSTDRGRALPVGTDTDGNEIYVCGRGGEKQGIENAIKSGIQLADGNVDGVMFVDTLPAVNNLMRIGGFLSRRLKWITLGRPLVIRGTQKAFPQLAQIANETKTKLKTTKTEDISAQEGKNRREMANRSE